MHSESYFSAKGKRTFDINIKGDRVRTNLDVFAEVGKNVALNLDFRDLSPVDGVLSIRFENVIEKPVVNGIIVGSVPLNRPTPTASPTYTPSPSVVPDVREMPLCSSGKRKTLLELNAGGPALTGIGYSADDTALLSVPHGLTYTSNTPVKVVADASNAAVHLTERFTRSSALTYNVPVANIGVYEVETRHSESFFSSSDSRVFNVTIRGTETSLTSPVTSAETIGNVDVYNQVVKNAALFLKHEMYMHTPGFIGISFQKVKENPLVKGIRVKGCRDSNVISRLMLNVGGGALPDLGFVVDTPAYIDGPIGRIFTSTESVSVPTGANNMDIFKTKRFASSSSLTYKIPVAPGVYQVTTLHVESFFSTTGACVFGIEINGRSEEKRLDLFAVAGKNVAVSREFVTSPVAGFSTITLVKIVQSPLLNGIVLENI